MITKEKIKLYVLLVVCVFGLTRLTYKFIGEILVFAVVFAPILWLLEVHKEDEEELQPEPVEEVQINVNGFSMEDERQLWRLEGKEKKLKEQLKQIRRQKKDMLSH